MITYKNYNSYNYNNYNNYHYHSTVSSNKTYMYMFITHEF